MRTSWSPGQIWEMGCRGWGSLSEAALPLWGGSGAGLAQNSGPARDPGPLSPDGQGQEPGPGRQGWESRGPRRSLAPARPGAAHSSPPLLQPPAYSPRSSMVEPLALGPARRSACCLSRGRSSQPRNFSSASLGPERNAPPPRVPALADPAPWRVRGMLAPPRARSGSAPLPTPSAPGLAGGDPGRGGGAPWRPSGLVEAPRPAALPVSLLSQSHLPDLQADRCICPFISHSVITCFPVHWKVGFVHLSFCLSS